MFGQGAFSKEGGGEEGEDAKDAHSGVKREGGGMTRWRFEGAGCGLSIVGRCFFGVRIGGGECPVEKNDDPDDDGDSAGDDEAEADGGEEAFGEVADAFDAAAVESHGEPNGREGESDDADGAAEAVDGFRDFVFVGHGLGQGVGWGYFWSVFRNRNAGFSFAHRGATGEGGELGLLVFEASASVEEGVEDGSEEEDCGDEGGDQGEGDDGVVGNSSPGSEGIGENEGGSQD